MTKFESTVLISAPISEVYDFLKNYQNHESLQPEHIQEWKATYEEATFSIQNWTRLSLQITERKENNSIVILPKGEAPFDLIMEWSVKEVDATRTEVHLLLQAKLNMMLKMMATSPLQKLVQFQTHQLTTKFS